MNHRIESLVEGIKGACSLKLLKWRVSHFNAEHVWVQDVVMAYNSRDAAKRLGLRAGYNCLVIRDLDLPDRG